MANEKISAMPTATDWDDVDIFPIVQGGVNKHTIRSYLLNAKTGQAVTVSGNGSSVAMLGDGNLNVNLDAGAALTISRPFGQLFICGSDDSITGQCGPGSFAIFGSSTNVVQFTDGIGIDMIISAGEYCNIPYVAANPTDWKVSPPSTLGAAMDRLSHAWFLAFGQIV